MMRRALRLALAGPAMAALLLAGAAYGQAPARAPVAGQFDHYMLALSWSPSYCASGDAARSAPLQCASDRPFSFVVHGLWPQSADGPLGGVCASREPADVPPPLETRMLDLMPSPRLVQQQWDRHGVCSGLSQAEYFGAVRAMRAKVVVPAAYAGLREPLRVTAAEVEQAFLKANPSLRADGLVVTCDERRLREVRICFAKDGRPRACGRTVRERCGERSLIMPPVRRAAAAR